MFSETPFWNFTLTCVCFGLVWLNTATDTFGMHHAASVRARAGGVAVPGCCACDAVARKGPFLDPSILFQRLMDCGGRAPAGGYLVSRSIRSGCLSFYILPLRLKCGKPLYVEPPPDENALTLEQAIEQLRIAHEAAQGSRSELEKQLAEWGLS